MNTKQPVDLSGGMDYGYGYGYGYGYTYGETPDYNSGAYNNGGYTYGYFSPGYGLSGSDEAITRRANGNISGFLPSLNILTKNGSVQSSSQEYRNSDNMESIINVTSLKTKDGVLKKRYDSAIKMSKSPEKGEKLVFSGESDLVNTLTIEYSKDILNDIYDSDYGNVLKTNLLLSEERDGLSGDDFSVSDIFDISNSDGANHPLKGYEEVKAYFDLSKVKNTEGLKIYYYDKEKKSWALYQTGGQIEGNKISFTFTDPLKVRIVRVVADSDNDGLPDYVEEVLGTDSLKADSDADGYNDRLELDNGYSPAGKGKITAAEAIRYEYFFPKK